MKMIKLLIVCLIIIFIATSVMADKTLFDCSIKRNKTLSPDGFVVTSFDDLKAELENKKLNGILDSMVTKYPSATETDRQVFKGQFKCKDNQLVIAVLSDDGVTVKVTNEETVIPTNVAFYEQGQALPNLDSSLKLVNGSWADGTTYNVEIDYSNTCYTGDGDIDGLTLYFCGDVELIPNPDPIVPDAGISISFPESTYNVGESTYANITIYGKTGNANIMATVIGLGINQTIVDVSSGYGVATVNIPTFSSPNTYVYTATAIINGSIVSNTTFINVISNTAPIVTNATAATNEDTPSNPITLTATDPDGDTLTYSINNPYTYTPPQDFNGVDIVTFTVDDGRGGISTGTITVTVNPINDAPVAYDGYFETDEDTETTIYYSGYDVDGDTVTPTIINGPEHGTLGIYDSITKSVSYTPAANFYGTDTIKFLLNDGNTGGNEATISINVKPVGDNISITAGKYLYANGTDSCNVSIVGLPNTAVILSTTGGTLSNTSLTTDNQGQASATLTSSIISGDVTITAAMLGDVTLAKVTFFTFDLQAANCITVPNSVIFASSIGKTGEKLNVNVVTTPIIDLMDTSLGFSFTGGVAGTANNYHTVAKDIAVETTLTASMRGVSKTCKVAVIKVTEIVADSTIISVFTDNSFSLNEKQAVTSWTATANSIAVLKVNVEPDIPAIHAIYDKLFVWSGGQAGDTVDKRTISRNSPSKTKISIKCGESSDVVVAWVAKVNVDIANVDDSIEDTMAGIATIYPNTDDDNNTATTGYDGSDLGESTVNGENDLVPISLSVEPAGIGGKFMLNMSSALKLQVRRNADKSGTVPPLLFWIIPTDPNTTEIMPQLLYLEGQEVSDDNGDQIIKAEYYWGESKLDLYGEDTVKATVKPRDGDSEVSICVFNPAKNSQGVNIPGIEKYTPIGGKMFVGLKIKVGPGERLATTLQSMMVKIQDDYSYVGDPAFARYNFNLTTAANWFELKNAGTSFQKWEPAVIAPNDLNGNKNGSSARIFCKIFEWDTSFTPSLNFTPPMGHNGAHTLEIVKINGLDGNKALFQHYNTGWQTAYEKEVPVQKAVVKNLVVTNVSTSNGTEDYFKYDPTPGSPYNRPVINFTIEDEGDPHEYDAVILMWPTSITADVFSLLTTSDAVAWIENTHLSTGNVSKTWDGSLIPLNYAGHEADQADWSTYAFEICVYEYPDSNAKLEDFTDWFYLRWPYCLSIPNDPFDGHDVWINTTDERDELRCFYKLSDYCQSNINYSQNFISPENVFMTPIDDMLNEQYPSIQGGNSVGIKNDSDDDMGVLVYTQMKMYGTWRVIFTGEDNCWKEYRRDHMTTHMFAVNATKSADWVDLDRTKHKGIKVSLNRAYTDDHFLRAVTWNALCETVDWMRKKPEWKGKSLLVFGANRSQQHQEDLYNKASTFQKIHSNVAAPLGWLKVNEDVLVNGIMKKGGVYGKGSQHQSGYAIDVKQEWDGKTDELPQIMLPNKWIKYIGGSPSETWHFEYGNQDWKTKTSNGSKTGVTFSTRDYTSYEIVIDGGGTCIHFKRVKLGGGVVATKPSNHKQILKIIDANGG